MLRERIFQINAIFNLAEMQLPCNCHPYVRDIGYYYYCYYFKSGKILDFIFPHSYNVGGNTYYLKRDTHYVLKIANFTLGQ